MSLQTQVERLRETAGQGLVTAECLIGGAVSSQIRAHHERRLGRIGWSRALDPPAGLWASGEPPPRPGNAIEVLIDGAEALPAIAEELRGRAVARPPHRLVLHARTSRSSATASRSSCATCSPSSPSGSTCACSSGRARRCRSSARRAHEVRKMRDELIARHADPVRARRARTAAALPSREDDRDRRPRRLRRRHRPDLRGRRPLRHDRPSGARRRSAGTTPRADRGPGGRRRRRALPHALARGHRRDARRRRADRARRQTSSCRSCAPCRRRSTTAPAARRLRDPRVVRPRASRQRERFIYLENQFLWSPEIAAVLRDKLARPAVRRLPDRRSCCRRSRTPAATTRAACSAS